MGVAHLLLKIVQRARRDVRPAREVILRPVEKSTSCSDLRGINHVFNDSTERLRSPVDLCGKSAQISRRGRRTSGETSRVPAILATRARELARLDLVPLLRQDADS
jgi:hypothetical protein